MVPAGTFDGSSGAGGQAGPSTGGNSGPGATSGTGGSGGPTAQACVPSGPAGAPPTVAVCGDGWLSPGEQCDDGNTANNDACSSTCAVTPSLVAPHAGSSGVLPFPGRELGDGAHPMAAGCNKVGVSYLDRAATPAALKLATFSNVGLAQAVVDIGTAGVDSPSPSLAALSDDTFVAAWTEFDSDELGVRLRRIDPAATTQADPVFANSGQDYSQRSPDVVFDGTRVVVAWVDDADPLNGPDLRYRMFDADLNPTSDDLTLAATSAVEDHVTLAAFHGNWAAAWRSGSGGAETIEVQSGSTHWSVGPFLPGSSDDRPALAFIDPTHLVVAFSEGTEGTGDDVANVPRLHGAVLDAAYPGHAESFEVKPTIEPYASSLGLSQTEPAITSDGDRLVVAWRSSSAIGDPAGDELWSREIKWTAGTGNTVVIDTSAPERSLLATGELRGGDQAKPTLLSSTDWPDHRLLSVWEDSGKSFGSRSGLPEVALQFSQVPGELASPPPGPCSGVTIAISPPGPAVDFTSVTLTATATCGAGAEAEYQFGYQDPTGTTWTLIRGWGSATANWSTAGVPSGNYPVYAYARRKGTTVPFDSNAGVGYLVGKVCYANASMTATPTGVEPIGTVLTLSGAAMCSGTGTIPEYRSLYWLPGSSTWSWVSDWSTTPVSWNTTGLPSGSYTLLTHIRAHGNASGFESYAYGGALLGNVCYQVNSVSPTGLQALGGTVALSATATCVGSTAPEFLYYYYAPGSGSPVQVGSWSSSPVGLNTTGLQPGNYTVLAYTRGVGNNSGNEASAYGGFQLGSLCPSVTESVSPSSPQAIGEAVTVTGNAGCSPAEYAFYYRLWGNSLWILFHDWQAPPTASWNTTGLASGNYELRVDARIAGHAATETNTEIGYLLGDVCPGAGISASPASPHGVGTAVTLSAAASCTNSASAEYQFYYRAPGATFPTMIRSWGPSTVNWSTTSLPAGAYSIYAYARATGNTDTYDSVGESSYVFQ